MFFFSQVDRCPCPNRWRIVLVALGACPNDGKDLRLYVPRCNEHFKSLAHNGRVMREIAWTVLLRFINARARIGRYFDVVFTINYSLALVPIAVAVYCYPDVRLFFALMSFCAGIAASVLFHEICHAGVGRWVGRPAKEIGLLPLGGFTLFRQFPGSGWTDFFVSLAGPLANGFICVVLVVLEIGMLDGGMDERLCKVTELLFGDDCTMENLQFIVVWANAVLRINVVLLLFNIIPAFPLDGGRALRILLAHALKEHHAGVATMVVSRAIAVGMFMYTLIDAIIAKESIMEIPIVLAMSVLIWCMSGSEVMRTENQEASESLKECSSAKSVGSPASNKASLTCPVEYVATCNNNWF